MNAVVHEHVHVHMNTRVQGRLWFLSWNITLPEWPITEQWNNITSLFARTSSFYGKSTENEKKIKIFGFRIIPVIILTYLLAITWKQKLKLIIYEETFVFFKVIGTVASSLKKYYLNYLLLRVRELLPAHHNVDVAFAQSRLAGGRIRGVWRIKDKGTIEVPFIVSLIDSIQPGSQR